MLPPFSHNVRGGNAVARHQLLSTEARHGASTLCYAETLIEISLCKGASDVATAVRRWQPHNYHSRSMQTSLIRLRASSIHEMSRRGLTTLDSTADSCLLLAIADQSRAPRSRYDIVPMPDSNP